MRPCPEAMTRAKSEVKPSGFYYRGMQMVVAAVDSMAILLIGGRIILGERKRIAL